MKMQKNRLTAVMAAAAMASMAAMGSAAAATPSGAAPRAVKVGKTKEPSASVGGRGYGARKFGTTAAYQRDAKKRANVRRHRMACR